MSSPEDIAGPIILWVDNGCEGWSPSSFPTIKAALEMPRYTSNFKITRAIEYDAIEINLVKWSEIHDPA
jgi:hypothetical protein